MLNELQASAAGTRKYIVVEGPIGAGKTTLTGRLALHLNAREMLEDPGSNPFLPRFYQEPARYALSAQLFFLLQRVQQVRDLNQRNLLSHVTVADFMLDKDPLFAQLNLEPEEYALYENVYRHMRPDAPTPDLVIYLQGLARRPGRTCAPTSRRLRTWTQPGLPHPPLRRLCALLSRVLGRTVAYREF